MVPAALRSQTNMEEVMQLAIDATSSPDVIGMTKLLETKFVACDYEKKTLRLAFPALAWEMNPRYQMQGGIIGSLFDLAMGFLGAYYVEDSYLTTLDLTTHFIKPVPFGDTLVMDLELLSQGKTILNLRGTARLERSGILAAAAEGTFMIVKGMKNTPV